MFERRSTVQMPGFYRALTQMLTIHTYMRRHRETEISNENVSTGKYVTRRVLSPHVLTLAIYTPPVHAAYATPCLSVVKLYVNFNNTLIIQFKAHLYPIIK